MVIRTLGTAGESYKRLIESINKQIIKPEEIIVVLPVGYTLDYVTGEETIVYSDKGMVSQRAVGIQCAKSEYILVVDDDIFPPNPKFNFSFILTFKIKSKARLASLYSALGIISAIFSSDSNLK